MIVYDVVMEVKPGAETSVPPGRWHHVVLADETEALELAAEWVRNAEHGVRYVVEAHEHTCPARRPSFPTLRNPFASPDRPPCPCQAAQPADPMEAAVRALVYRNHCGDTWYAYAPCKDDDLDAGGSVAFMECDTREEAEAYVRDAIRVASERPRDTCEGMGDPPWE